MGSEGSRGERELQPWLGGRATRVCVCVRGWHFAGGRCAWVEVGRIDAVIHLVVASAVGT